MQYRGYLGKVVFEDDAGIYYGEVVGLRDVITFQGENLHEPRAAFEQSIDDYLALCQQRGEEPEKPA
jgi:predicted HicB family RNase H-like nuclease